MNEDCASNERKRCRMNRKGDVMSKEPIDQTAEWNDTANGLLTGYAHRMQRRRLLVLSAKTASVSVCLAAAGLGGWLEYLRRLETDYQNSGLTCSDVRELMSAYRTAKLDAKRRSLLEKHVRHCANCAEFQKELRAETT